MQPKHYIRVVNAVLVFLGARMRVWRAEPGMHFVARPGKEY
jgi:hypothetical protein